MGHLWLFRPALTVLSPPGSRGRLSILIYHRVLVEPDPLRPAEPTVDRFRWQMELMARLFNVLPLHEAVTRLTDGDLPARAACVTFDDGYADNCTIALPVLRALGIPATFFIATGFMNGGRMFNDTVIEAVRRLPDGDVDLGTLGLGIRTITSDNERLTTINELLPILKYADLDQRQALLDALPEPSVAGLPDDLMLDDRQVVELHNAGMEIGAHTVRHPILTRLTPDEARQEIVDSRDTLESLIGEPVRVFAYPNGQFGEDYSEVHVTLVRESGFAAAVSTHMGVSRLGDDPFQLPRFTPWDRTATRFAGRLAWNLVP